MMSMTTRRRALLAVATTLTTSARAQERSYPDRSVTIVVPAAAGGGGDFAARILGDRLTRDLGQTFIVDNRVGGGGTVAAMTVARASPDGYTVLLAYSGTHVTLPSLFPNLPWDPERSFTPIALILRAPHVIVVRRDLAAATLAELADLARRNPGRLTYASSGAGTIQHIGGEWLAGIFGAPMLHVPYRGAGPAMNDLVAGTIDMMITTPPAVVGLLRDGSIRALAIASSTRHEMLPEVPTTNEAGFTEFELEAWFAIYAPAGTPRPVIDRLSNAVGRAVAEPVFQRRSIEAGTIPAFMGPEELATFTHSELGRWSEIIRRLGIRSE
jgi:tripartite-type tricarboxylate transporter receptor subunit TctC